MPEEEDEPPQPLNKRQTVHLLGLVVVSFFWISGGPYGLEPMIKSGAPLDILLGNIVVPILVGVPVSLITAELSSAVPEDGGAVAWVQLAFGSPLGPHNAYWSWAISIIDAAVYPVLFVDYVNQLISVNTSYVQFTSIQGALLAVALVWFVTCFKLVGVDVLVRFSTMLAVVTLLPFALFLGFGLPRMKPTIMFNRRGDTQWAEFLSYLLWLYTGFMSMGSIAGEVDNPKKDFPVSMLVNLPLVILINLLPVAVSLSIDPERNNYETGYFMTIASELVGKWLEYFFLVGAVISCIGLYNAQAITAERIMSSFAEKNQYLSKIVPKERSDKAPTGLQKIKGFFWGTKSTGVSRVYILINALACSGMILFSSLSSAFQFLVEFEMVLYTITLGVFLLSFVVLKVTRKDIKRPFEVPGGLGLAIFLFSSPVMVYVGNLVIAIMDEGQYTSLYSTAVVIGVGIAVHVLAIGLEKLVRFTSKSKSSSFQSEDDPAKPLLSNPSFV